MNRWKINIVLLVLLIALAILMFREQNSTQRGDDIVSLTPLLASEITTINYQSRGNDTFVLEKEQDIWWLIYGANRWLANPFHVDKIISLFSLTSERSYEFDASSLEQFGLIEPLARVSAGAYEIVFGDLNPLHYQRYVQQGERLHLVFDDVASLGLGWLQVIDPILLPKGQQIIAIDIPDVGRLTQLDGQWSLAGQEALSADELVQLHDAWRHARAMKVTALASINLSEFPLVNVEFEQRETIDLFVVSNNDQGLVLASPAVGLMYHFSPHQTKKLMSLSSTNKMVAD